MNPTEPLTEIVKLAWNQIATNAGNPAFDARFVQAIIDLNGRLTRAEKCILELEAASEIIECYHVSKSIMRDYRAGK